MEWKDIKGFNGYMVSDTGLVMGKRGRILKPILHPKGYLKVHLYRDTRMNARLIHRLVAIHYVENPLNKPEVNHKDGNKQNNNKSNLEWVTKLENIEHAWEIGLLVAEKQGRPKGVNDEELAIILKSRGIVTAKELGTKYGLKPKTIRQYWRAQK